MLCRRIWKTHEALLVLALGLASFFGGLLGYLLGQPEGQNLNMLLGMFSGFGFALTAAAVFHLVRRRVASREKLEQEAIEAQDERNRAIRAAAGLVGFWVACGVLCALVFLFMGLGYRVPAYVCLAGLYVAVGGYLLAGRVIARRM